MVVVDFDEFLNEFKTPDDVEFNDQIVSIEPYENVEVCDIQVSGDNLFYANDVLVHNCAVNKVDDVDNSAISDSLGTSMTSDFMIFLLQNEEMKAKSEIVCKVTKNRFNGRTDTWMMGIDYPKMKFHDIELPNDQTFKTFEDKTNAENFAKKEIMEHEIQSRNVIKVLDKKQNLNSVDDFIKELGI